MSTVHLTPDQDAASAIAIDPPANSGRWGGRSLAALRLAMGFVFLWAFFDKLVGPGYSTAVAKSWLAGGSPTAGFLGHVDVGPLRSLFRSWAGAGWADIGFMAGLAAVGIAVLAGVALRIAAFAGSLMMLLMWAAEWPLARLTLAGEPSGSTNPLVDYHVIYALSLLVIAVLAAGDTWGFGRRWAQLRPVRQFAWLR